MPPIPPAFSSTTNSFGIQPNEKNDFYTTTATPSPTSNNNIPPPPPLSEPYRPPIQYLSDSEFIYRAHKSLLSWDDPYENEFIPLICHYEACSMYGNCQNPNCVRILSIMEHLNTCQVEFCHLCMPMRWLFTSTQLSTIYTSVFRISRWTRAETYAINKKTGGATTTTTHQSL
jgi:hypothetical protein